MTTTTTHATTAGDTTTTPETGTTCPQCGPVPPVLDAHHVDLAEKLANAALDVHLAPSGTDLFEVRLAALGALMKLYRSHDIDPLTKSDTLAATREIVEAGYAYGYRPDIDD